MDRRLGEETRWPALRKSATLSAARATSEDLRANQRRWQGRARPCACRVAEADVHADGSPLTHKAWFGRRERRRRRGESLCFRNPRGVDQGDESEEATMSDAKRPSTRRRRRDAAPEDEAKQETLRATNNTCRHQTRTALFTRQTGVELAARHEDKQDSSQQRESRSQRETADQTSRREPKVPARSHSLKDDVANRAVPGRVSQ